MKIMTQKQSFIKRAFTHNRREKLLAVLCSVVIMIVAVCFKPVNRVYSLRVNANISPDQVLVSENVSGVEVKVSGNFFELRKVKSEDLVINFDFSKERAGEITMNIGDKELPAAFLPLDVKSISPEIIVFRTEDKKAETSPEPLVEMSAETSPKEKQSGETSPETSSEQKPVEMSHETSPKEPASGGKND